jgi:hypothetical protein
MTAAVVEFDWVRAVISSVTRGESRPMAVLCCVAQCGTDHPLIKLLLEMYGFGITGDTTCARDYIFELGDQCAESADLVLVEGWAGRILSATAAGMVLAVALPADYLCDIAGDRNIVRRGFIFPTVLTWPRTVELDPEAVAAAARNGELAAADSPPEDELSCIIWVVCNGADSGRALAAITAGRFHPEIALALAVMCAARGLSSERVEALSGAVTASFADPANRLTAHDEQQLRLPPVIV